jgi:hypothetical protein
VIAIHVITDHGHAASLFKMNELGFVDAEVTGRRKCVNYTGRLKCFWVVRATEEERRDRVYTSLKLHYSNLNSVAVL